MAKNTYHCALLKEHRPPLAQKADSSVARPLYEYWAKYTMSRLICNCVALVRLLLGPQRKKINDLSVCSFLSGVSCMCYSGVLCWWTYGCL